MTRALKLVLLATYLTATYGVALPAGGHGGSSDSNDGPTVTSKHGSTKTKTHTGATSTSTGGGQGNVGTGVNGPVIDRAFPNPCLIQVKNKWYSFAASYDGKHIQMATSTDFENWEYSHQDAMPDISAAKWIARNGDIASQGPPHSTETAVSMSRREVQSESSPKTEQNNYGTQKTQKTKTHESTGSSTKHHKPTDTSSKHPEPTGGYGPNFPNIRKPDVIQTPEGKFVMQFTSRHENSVHRCIGVAQANNIEGPYVPEAKPLHCENDDGGDFDSAFYQEGEKLYMVYNKRSQQIENDTPEHTETAMPPGHTGVPKGGKKGDSSTRTNPATLERRARPNTDGDVTNEATRVATGPPEYQTGTKTGKESTHSLHSKKPTDTKSANTPKGTGAPDGNKYRPSALSLLEVSTEKHSWGLKPATENSTELLHSEERDAPGVSAPYMVKVNGVYFLTFSTNRYNSSAYDIEYATSHTLKGEFKRATQPLLAAGDFPKLNGPGGASFSRDGKHMVFQNRGPAQQDGSHPPGHGPTHSIYPTNSLVHPTYTATRVGAPQHTDLPKKQQNERRAGNKADDEAGQMTRMLWTANVEYQGETMSIAGSKKNGTDDGNY